MADSTVHLQQATIDPLDLPVFAENNLDVRVLRLDKIHPEISGNKWFKLKYYLEAARLEGKKRLISFGGPYSNHLVALACAAQAEGFASTGFVRGEKPALLSPSLFAAMKYGMEVQFLSRAVYRNKEDPGFLSALRLRYPDALLIPEGGAGAPGIRGAGEILSLHHTRAYSHICAALGTGATFAGLIRAGLPQQQMTGISVLKGTTGFDPLPVSETEHPETLRRVRVIHAYSFGGYAKKTPALLDFMNRVYERSGIPTDFVYTGKLLYAIADLARKKYFPEGSRILIIHSGGLQGNLSLPAGRLHF